MLEDILRQRKCFKLVCGAGNEDAQEVEKLVALYAKAGANYFDLSAREEIVQAANSGLRRVISEDKLKDYYFNVSVGIKGDPHVSKANINVDTCIACGICSKVCLQRAVNDVDGRFDIEKKRCIGCGACIRNCPKNAIDSLSENKDLKEILPSLINMGIDSIELHIVSEDYEKIFDQWNIINSIFDGVLSICTDRSHSSDKQLVSMLKELLKGRKTFSTIIQADGAPMSGCDDKPSTTLQAISTAQIVERADLQAYLLLSGGTNSKTTELANLFDVGAHGIAIGSYGRMIVSKFIEREDFFENKEVFDSALQIAKKLVNTSLAYLGEEK